MQPSNPPKVFVLNTLDCHSSLFETQFMMTNMVAAADRAEKQSLLVFKMSHTGL